MSFRAARVFFSCLILTLTLLACSGRAPAPAIQAAVTAALTSTKAATRIPAPSLTPFPTETSRPSPTALPNSTFTPAPSSTATPDAALGQVKLLGLGWIKDYNMLLSFQFPGPVETSQYRVMLEEKEFTCQKLAKYPDRLYCIGPGAKVLKYAWIRIYPAGSSAPVFEMERWIPYFDDDYNNQFLPPY